MKRYKYRDDDDDENDSNDENEEGDYMENSICDFQIHDNDNSNISYEG